jgi:hypothetical protein
MDRSLQREWQIKMRQKLIGVVRFVNNVRPGKFGLVIEVEKDTPQIRQAVYNIFEKECEDVPFSFSTVGRVVSVRM